MGTAFTPNYANLFMDRFETKALNGWHMKPTIWLCYMDDVFMILTHGGKELDNFIKYLNGIHEKIKLTSEISDTSINFLDTTVKIDTDHTLYTTLCEKPTYTNLCLHYDSAQHKPCHTKGQFGQFLRVRRICSNNENFIDNGINLIEYYLKRGYPFKQLKNHMLRAFKYSQDELLEVKTNEQTDVPVVTTKYNPSNLNIKNFVHRNWNIIQNSKDCIDTFSHKPIIGFKRLQNLRDMLTNDTISYPPKEIVTKKLKPNHCT